MQIAQGWDRVLNPPFPIFYSYVTKSETWLKTKRCIFKDTFKVQHVKHELNESPAQIQNGLFCCCAEDLGWHKIHHVRLLRVQTYRNIMNWKKITRPVEHFSHPTQCFEGNSCILYPALGTTRKMSPILHLNPQQECSEVKRHDPWDNTLKMKGYLSMHKSLQRGRDLNKHIIIISDYVINEKQDRFRLDVRKDFNSQDSPALELSST